MRGHRHSQACKAQASPRRPARCAVAQPTPNQNVPWFANSRFPYRQQLQCNTVGVLASSKDGNAEEGSIRVPSSEASHPLDPHLPLVQAARAFAPLRIWIARFREAWLPIGDTCAATQAHQQQMVVLTNLGTTVATAPRGKESPCRRASG